MIGCGTWFQLRGLFQFGNGVGKIFLGEQGFSGAKVCRGGIFVQLQGETVFLQCRGVVLLECMKITEMKVRLRIGRIELSRNAKFLPRAFEI